MKNINFKKIVPHIVAVLLFLSITAVYFSPLLEGKVMRQMDYTHTKGQAKELTDYYQKTGTHALWTNSMFSGMPAYQIQGGTSYNIFYYISRFFRFGLPFSDFAVVFTYLLGFYLLLISFRVNPWVSIAGAVAFGFSSYNFIFILAGHVMKTYAIAYMAPVIAGVIMTYKGRYFLGGIITTIALGIEIACNHVQITYYLFIIIMIIAAVYFIYSVKEKEIKKFIIASCVLAFAAVLSVLPNYTNLAVTNEYSKYTIRGKSELTQKETNQSSGLDKDYAFAWSYGKAETFTLLIPNAMSGNLDKNSHICQAIVNKGVPENDAENFTKNLTSYTYWGAMPFASGPCYFGAIICFLFVLGLFVVKGKEKWWLLIATILSIMLAWGRNLEWFNDFFFYHVPLYSKFRAVSTTLVMASFTVPLLGFLALKNIVESEDKKTFVKPLMYSFCIAGGLTLIFALLPGMFFDFTSSNDTSNINRLPIPDEFKQLILQLLPLDRESLLRSDAWRSFAFILLSAATLLLYMKNKLKLNLCITIIICLVLIDLWAVDKRYLNDDYFVSKKENRNEFQPTEANLQILQDPDPNFRVYNQNNPFNEVNTSYFHKSIGGYHGAKLRRYQDIIDRQIGNGNMKVLDMLNAKYVIAYDQSGKSVAMRNPNALGNCWFVDDYKIVDNADQEIAALDNFEPSKTAIVDKRFESVVSKIPPKIAIDTLDASFIRLTEYKPDYLSYESNANRERLAVFSEIYYEKGWNAYVDGKLTPHIRADYVLRAMPVPAGNHKIEFKFEPRTYYLGQKISLMSSVIVVILVIGVIVWEVKRPKVPSVS